MNMTILPFSEPYLNRKGNKIEIIDNIAIIHPKQDIMIFSKSILCLIENNKKDKIKD